MYQYWAFGLKINSDIEFPELLIYDFEDADITIKIGSCPDRLDGENVTHKVRISASPTEYLQHINGIATYYVRNGTDITIQAEKGADIASIRLFMLTNSMAAILHQRGSIPFHASGIVTDNGVTLFTGRSGVGKSTTVLALMQEGYQLFTDDVCVLQYNTDTNTVEAIPSYPMMKVWENTIDEIATSISKNYNVRPGLPKYGFFQHENFINSPLPIERVFCLRSNSQQKEFHCIQTDKVTGFHMLQRNTYRRAQVELMKLNKVHFEIISKLANQVQVFEVLRPETTDIRSFIQYIQQYIHA